MFNFLKKIPGFILNRIFKFYNNLNHSIKVRLLQNKKIIKLSDFNYIWKIDSTIDPKLDNKVKNSFSLLGEEIKFSEID